MASAMQEQAWETAAATVTALAPIQPTWTGQEQLYRFLYPQDRTAEKVALAGRVQRKERGEDVSL